MNPRLFSSIERLEDRIAPAGIIKVTYTAGQLTLAGDAAGNSLSLAFSDSSTVVLRGLDGTSLIVNGHAAAGDVEFAGFSGSIKAALGDGNDTIQLGPGAFPGDVSLDLGSGDNKVITSDLTVAGNLSVTGANGADSIVFGGSRTVVHGNLSLDLGDGANSVMSGLGAFAVGGNLNVKTGSGKDSLVFGGSDYVIGGDTVIATGPGSDTVGFFASNVGVFGGKLSISSASSAGQSENFAFSGNEQLVFRGAVAIELGAGNGAVALHSDGKLHVQSDLSIDSGHGADRASVTAADVSVDGNVSVKSTGGVDFKVAATDTLDVAGNLSVAGGSGADHVTISGGGEIDGTVSVDLGTGSDQTITIEGTAAKSLVLKSAVNLVQDANSGISTTTLLNADFLAALTYSASNADDTLKIANVTFASEPSIAASGGNDVLDLSSVVMAPLSTATALGSLVGSTHNLATIITSPATDKVMVTGSNVLEASATADLTSASLESGISPLQLDPLSAESPL